MSAMDHYPDRIARATERLSQLQASDLLARQRRDKKAKDLAKPEKARRRQRTTAIITSIGADRLNDDELAGSLQGYLKPRKKNLTRTAAGETSNDRRPILKAKVLTKTADSRVQAFHSNAKDKEVMSSMVKAVDVFSTPFEVHEERNATMEEMRNLVKQGKSIPEAMRIRGRLIETISSHVEAAARMLRVGVDNALESHVDRKISESSQHKELLAKMPEQVPEVLASYQSEYQVHLLREADEAINAHGVAMPEGQFLFHGGVLLGNEHSFITTRPLSTSFCPQVALRNAEWQGKAFDAGRVELAVLRVQGQSHRAFVFGSDGDHGHEKEVVFASGIRLTLVSKIHVTDVNVVKVSHLLQEFRKKVPAYLVEIEIDTAPCAGAPTENP